MAELPVLLATLLVLGRLTLGDTFSVCDKRWFPVKSRHQCMHFVRGPSLHGTAKDTCQTTLNSALPDLKTDSDVSVISSVIKSFGYKVGPFWTDFSISNVNGDVTVVSSAGDVITNCVGCLGAVTSENITAIDLVNSSRCVYVDPGGDGVLWRTADCATEKQPTICVKPDNGVTSGSSLTMYDVVAIIVACVLVLTLVVVVFVSAKKCPDNVHSRHKDTLAVRKVVPS